MSLAHTTMIPSGDTEGQPSAWAALLSVQKENARLRKLVAENGPATKMVTRSAMRRRVSFQIPGEEDELEDETEEEEEEEEEEKETEDKSDEVQSAEERSRLKKLVRWDKTRLKSLESGLKTLAADKAKLLEAQQLFDTQRTELTKFHEQLLAAKAEIEAERTRSQRQNAADAQQTMNRCKEAERRVKGERRELEGRIKGDWARVVEWKRQLEVDTEKLRVERSRMGQSSSWLVGENARLEELSARLEADNTHLVSQNANLAQTATDLQQENGRIEELLDDSKRAVARIQNKKAQLEELNRELMERERVAQDMLNAVTADLERARGIREEDNALHCFSPPQSHSSPGFMLASPPQSSPTLRSRKRGRAALHDDEDYENTNARVSKKSTMTAAGTTLKLRPRGAAVTRETIAKITTGAPSIIVQRLPLVPPTPQRANSISRPSTAIC
ncbi:hypothetical protein B0H16DRAFT_1503886 [Mycena metata]|uniref:Uncharacterized protein n=1 Tax=Mycena metata TaxID=1033252 RepID=A0AAD7K5C1_9AGAR|nr:hypothetical protein B0H16DRAFT_1503886 [Mycena metata]